MPKPDERFERALPNVWGWRPGPVTDWIDMEFIFDELEANVRAQLIAVRLETMSAVHRTLAEGAAKAAKIVAGARTGGKK
jgi:hypothetical protein